MNNAGIVDRVDCVCKLNRVSPETQNPLHALSGDHLFVESDECYISVGKVKISPTPSSSTSLDNHEFDIISVKQISPKSHTKRNKPFNCGFLRKKISDKNGSGKNTLPISNCICKTHKWKFPLIMQKAWKHNRRVRLKSIPSINNMPLQRYQSHHSSSDEDWFEEVADDEVNPCDEKKNKSNSDENISFTNIDNSSVTFETESDHIVSNKFKWCSFAFKHFCNKPPLTESKITQKDSKKMCRII